MYQTMVPERAFYACFVVYNVIQGFEEASFTRAVLCFNSRRTKEFSDSILGA